MFYVGLGELFVVGGDEQEEVVDYAPGETADLLLEVLHIAEVVFVHPTELLQEFTP